MLLVHRPCFYHYIPLCNVQLLTQFIFYWKQSQLSSALERTLLKSQCAPFIRPDVSARLLAIVLPLFTYPFSSAANHSIMTKRVLWLSRKWPMCLTSQWLHDSWLYLANALTQPNRALTERTTGGFPQTAGEMQFGGEFLHVFQSFGRMFLLDVSFLWVLCVRLFGTLNIWF